MSDADEIPDDYHIVVSDFADVDSARKLTGREKELAVELFETTDWDHIVWFETWLLQDDDKDIATVEGSENLAVGVCEDYSEKAVRFYQPQREDDVGDPGGYAPKKCIVWLERSENMDGLETPQGRLGDFAP